MTRRLDPATTIRPSRFAHFVLRVRDLKKSVAWYQTVVGMEMVHGTDFIAFMTYDDEHHRIALVETPQKEAAPPGAAGLDHVAYTLDDLGDLLGTYRRLEAKGILPAWCINHGPTTSLYYQDPDGNRVEFQVDNFESVEAVNSWIRSSKFAENPIGVEFDPEKLISRYEGGDPIEELLKQGATA